MATQTLIQLKYSIANSAPSTLSIAEPAYSFVSDKMFIGDEVGGVIAIGGQFYTNLLDSNTFYATPDTIMRRDGNGSTQLNNLSANNVFSNNVIYAGLAAASPLVGATNPIIGAGGNANTYVQAYVRNINSGTEASADFAAYSDIGSDVSGWIDMGITSSNYQSQFYTLTGPEEGYILMSATNGSGTSGNLIIATDSTGVHNDIVFQTGGFTGAKRPLMRLRNNIGVIIDYENSSTSNSSGALVVKGGVGVQDALYADAIYDNNGRVLTTVTPVAGGGISFAQSKSGNTVTLTVNNTGVNSLTANTNQLTSNGTTGNIVIGLATTAVTPGTYGGTTQVPSFTVDSFGRLTQAGNVSISTSFALTGNTGTDTFNTGDTLFLKGDGTGIVTTVTDNAVSFATDTTVLRSNTTSVGPQFIQTDLTVTGNLIVTGTQIVSNTSYVETQDSLIKLAANNTTDVLDIGFYGQYNSSGTKYAGLIRKAGDKFYLLKDITSDPTSNTVTFDASNRATIDANITGGIISSLSAAIGITDGGTNNTSFSNGQIIHFDGAKLASLANTGTAGTYGAASRTLTISTDALGRVSSVSNNAIAIDTSQITTGTLGIGRGGTGASSFTIKGVVVSDQSSTTGALSALTGSSYEVLQLNASGVPVFGGLNGGTF
jgi:hypothetical protein